VEQPINLSKNLAQGYAPSGSIILSKFLKISQFLGLMMLIPAPMKAKFGMKELAGSISLLDEKPKNGPLSK